MGVEHRLALYVMHPEYATAICEFLGLFIVMTVMCTK